MRDEQVLLTPEGVKKLEDELTYLKTVRRREVAERIKVALGYGDLSENSEYDEAKNEQAFVEGRIGEIDRTLRNAKVVEEASVNPAEVNVGSTVELRDLEVQEELTYTIVGPSEADPMNNRISYRSPVGRALMGHRSGEVVDVELPEGSARFQLLSVRR